MAAVAEAPAPAAWPLHALHPDLCATITALVEAYEELANASVMHEDTDAETSRVEQLLERLGIDVDEDGHASIRG